MTKICIIIVASYILYYAGNIIYDLFLKRDPSVEQNEIEEYSLAENAEGNKNEIKRVSIDDVENLNTPNSFNKKEAFPVVDGIADENRDLDYWRQKFESEQDIDSFDNAPETIEKPKGPTEVPAQDTIQGEKVQTEEKKDPVPLVRDPFGKQFHQFLNLAETQVQLLSDRDGHRVYHSMI